MPEAIDHICFRKLGYKKEKWSSFTTAPLSDKLSDTMVRVPENAYPFYVFSMTALLLSGRETA